MDGALEFGRRNGWLNLLGRATRAAQRRMRDQAFARRLQAPGFRAGASPRVLGLSHMVVGTGFHAGDGLWLEAVERYEEADTAQTFAPRLRIGKDARLSDQVHIACLNEVSIGDDLLCGSRVLITDHAHGVYSGGEGESDPAVPPARRALHSAGTVHIGKNVWLGDGVTVLPGAVIGDGCVVGANAVVRGVLPEGSISVGVPARVIRRWNAASGRWEPATA